MDLAAPVQVINTAGTAGLLRELDGTFALIKVTETHDADSHSVLSIRCERLVSHLNSPEPNVVTL